MLYLLFEINKARDCQIRIVSFVRFGFRQPHHAKTAKVGDVSVAAEPAFGAPLKDKETAINNNALGKYTNRIIMEMLMTSLDFSFRYLH